jgi:hypothetical protein
MALTGPQRAAVLAAIQAARDGHASPIIRAALLAQLARQDDGVTCWTVNAGRVSILVDEQPGDAAAADVLARFAGQLVNLLSDRLRNP